VVRAPKRGAYDRKTAYGIIDSTPLCHVSYIIDGQPYVTPTFQWREGDRIFWHGSSASRMLRKSEGQPVCLAVTQLDGFVLARSAFHHSVNYRSVMLFGTPVKVEGEEKERSLENFIEGLFPGRWATLRPMNEQEIKATTVLAMPIDEGSAKVRTGQPVDDEEDYALPIWSGVIPVHMSVMPPEPDSRNLDNLELPAHVTGFKLD
jgi:nitroimidazol reductase NimA-like FMN-containing flavoprotein (pyridoxamine 5'-phosphate oxidase superfamily)